MPLSEQNLISEAEKHLKELTFFNVMGKLELHPSQSRVSEVFVPIPLTEHVMNHCVASMIPVGAFVGPLCGALCKYSILSPAFELRGLT